MATAPPVGPPGPKQWKGYERWMNRVVIAPLIGRMKTALDAAGVDYQDIYNAIQAIPSDPSLQGLSQAAATRQAKYLKRYHTQLFERQMRRHLGIGVGLFDTVRLERRMVKHIKANVGLIRTVDTRVKTDLIRKFRDLSEQGAHFDQAQKLAVLNNVHGNARFNAMRIARDQTSKLIGQFNEIRQTEVGVEKYVWSSSGDQRVRHTHQDYDGKTYRWDKPPPEGNPGEPIMCRCVALAVIPPVRKQQAAQAKAKASAKRPSAKPAPRPVIPPAFVLGEADNILGRKVSGQAGSNPGGLYEGADGVRRYVKFYNNEEQAYGEAVANGIYRRLGLDAPKSTMFKHDNKWAIANEIIENGGEVRAASRITKAEALQVLDGFAADVLTDNWDAVGLNLDNIVFKQGGGFARIDQGGVLLYRARGALKPQSGLTDLDEWTNFGNPNINRSYASIFERAGLSSASDLTSAAWKRKVMKQLADIKKLQKDTDNFRDMIPELPGIGTRKQVIDLLNKRVAKLEERVDAVFNIEVLQPERLTQKARSFYTDIRKRLDGYEFAQLPEFFAAHRNRALDSYTGTGYRGLNKALRQLAAGVIDRLPENYEKMNASMLRISKKTQTEYRVFRSESKSPHIPDYQEGQTTPLDAWTSTSLDGNVSLNSYFHSNNQNYYDLILPKGTRVIMTNAGEREVILPPGTKIRILRIEDWSQNKFNSFLRDDPINKRVVAQVVLPE